VRYRYAGTFVLDNELQEAVKVRLPLNPDGIWERSSDDCFSYGSTHRMAYFWNPLGKGCKLVDGVDYFTADAAIVKKLANTTNTTPAYERLTTSSGEIRMVVAFGADDDRKGKLALDKNDDHNAPSYRDTRKFLLVKASRYAPSRSTSASASAEAQSRWPPRRAMSRSSRARMAGAGSSCGCSGVSPTSATRATPSSAWRRRPRNAVPFSSTPGIPAWAASISPTWATRSARPSR
jgi:hypothetical protein